MFAPRSECLPASTIGPELPDNGDLPLPAVAPSAAGLQRLVAALFGAAAVGQRESQVLR